MLPLLTFIPVSFALLPQTFMSWSAGSGGLQGARTVALVTMLLLVLSLVKVAAAVTIACALPYTTAVKGHVAVEYFYPG